MGMTSDDHDLVKKKKKKKIETGVGTEGAEKGKRFGLTSWLWFAVLPEPWNHQWGFRCWILPQMSWCVIWTEVC